MPASMISLCSDRQLGYAYYSQVPGGVGVLVAQHHPDMFHSGCSMASTRGIYHKNGPEIEHHWSLLAIPKANRALQGHNPMTRGYEAIPS